MEQIIGDKEVETLKENEDDAGAFFDGEQVREEERFASVTLRILHLNN
jgi:hypothetical protein